MCVPAHTRACGKNAEEDFTVVLSLRIVSYFSVYLDLRRRGGGREAGEGTQHRNSPSEMLSLPEKLFSVIDLLSEGAGAASSALASEPVRCPWLRAGYFHSSGRFHKAAALRTLSREHDEINSFHCVSLIWNLFHGTTCIFSELTF